MSTRALAAALGVTYEAARQQLAALVRAGWVAGERVADGGDLRPGPASRQYRLSAAAEHLFPKQYDALSAELLEQVRDAFGAEALVGLLKKMTDTRVEHWAPLLKSLSTKDKLRALSALYEDKDAYMELEWKEGAPALIERNCPFFSVAQQHPAICSVSVNTLERLLGCSVVREQRFQSGHGRCVFRVHLDKPRTGDASFTLEPPR